MGTTSKLAGALCMGTLLIACGGRQPLAAAAIPGADADAYYALGRVEHAARRFAAAQQAWTRALLLDPGHVDARNGMAVLLAEQGEYGKAIALWRTLADGSADRPRAERAFLFGNLGYALFLQGDREAALTMLQKACVLDPHEPLVWEHLAGVLEALGETDKAVLMMRQARTLRSHDIRADYALAGRAAAAPLPVPAAPATGASPWPRAQPVARTELRQAGAVVEVLQVRPSVAPAAPVAAEVKAEAKAVVASSASPGDSGAVRLEISNGNGTPGLAAAWARRLRESQWKSVRLTNQKPFAVPVTRIEYRDNAGDADDVGVVARALAERLGLPAPRPVAGGRSDLRIVLGWDQRDTQVRKESAQGAPRAP